MKKIHSNTSFFAAELRNTGVKHKRLFQPCQDSTLAELYDKFAIIAVADGHGHQMHSQSETGSAIACISAVETIKAWLTSGEMNSKNQSVSDVSRLIVSEWRKRVLENFADRCAEVTGRSQSGVYTLYGTTLLCAAVTEEYTYLFQIGDGKTILFKSDCSIYSPIEDSVSVHPDSLCLEDAGSRFRVAVVPSHDIESIVLCTDGVVNHFDTDESLLMHIQCGLLDHDLLLPENTMDDASIAVLIRKTSKK